MNVKLLRKVAKHILAEPLRYNQNATIARGIPGDVIEPDGETEQCVPACGTIACLGGWIALFTYKRPPRSGFSFRKIGQALGVTSRQVSALCSYTTSTSGKRWPAQYAKRYNRATTPRGRAKIAAERIEHFIKTGE